MRPCYRHAIPAATAPVGGFPRHKNSSVYLVLSKNPINNKVQLSGAAQHSFRGAPPSGRGAQEVEIGGGRLVDLGTMQQAQCGNRARCRAVRREAPATAPGAGAPAAAPSPRRQAVTSEVGSGQAGFEFGGGVPPSLPPAPAPAPAPCPAPAPASPAPAPGSRRDSRLLLLSLLLLGLLLLLLLSGGLSVRLQLSLSVCLPPRALLSVCLFPRPLLLLLPLLLHVQRRT